MELMPRIRAHAGDAHSGSPPTGATRCTALAESLRRWMRYIWVDGLDLYGRVVSLVSLAAWFVN